MSQQALLNQDMTISEIFRTYGKHFRQIQMRYSDGQDGRCAIGAIMSYYGWNGKDEPGSARMNVVYVKRIISQSFQCIVPMTVCLIKYLVVTIVERSGLNIGLAIGT